MASAKRRVTMIGPVSAIRRVGRDRTGTVAIEFAVVIVTVLLFVFLTLDFAIAVAGAAALERAAPGAGALVLAGRPDSEVSGRLLDGVRGTIRGASPDIVLERYAAPEGGTDVMARMDWRFASPIVGRIAGSGGLPFRTWLAREP